ncbi:hypothetical protein DFH09DRAFT_1367099 [Mycena vulgaris]|nr:hypothetical protein DFH09DRAFT_1367099 [Mycena vulgaris]
MAALRRLPPPPFAPAHPAPRPTVRQRLHRCLIPPPCPCIQPIPTRCALAVPPIQSREPRRWREELHPALFPHQVTWAGALQRLLLQVPADHAPAAPTAEPAPAPSRFESTSMWKLLVSPLPARHGPPPVALHLLLLAPVERAPPSVQRMRLRRRGVNEWRTQPKGRLDFKPQTQIHSVYYTQRGSEFRWYSVLLAIFDIQDYFTLRPTRILTLHLLSGLLVHDFYDATGLLTAFSAAIPPYPVFKVGCIAFPLSGRIHAADPKLGVSSEPCPDSPVALGGG